MVDPPYRTKNMMPGMTMLWDSSFGPIPSGWHECDGTMGTTDLRGCFVRGADVANPPGSTGGGEEHDHIFDGDSHDHYLYGGPDLAAGTDYKKTVAGRVATGTVEPGSSIPPFNSMFYITKIN